MFFKKNEAINHRIENKPRVAYKKTTEITRRINIFLSAVSLGLIIITASLFLTEVFKDKEAYFGKSNGDFKLINYSNEVNKKTIEIINERLK